MKKFLPVLLALASSFAANAVTKTWNGSVSSDWSTPGNWTPAGVPAPTDSIVFTGGTITLSVPVAHNGPFDWSVGRLIASPAPLLLDTNAVMTLTPGNYKFLSGTVSNRGVLRLINSTTLYLDNSPAARLINLPGGLVDSTGADLFECDGTCGGVIENRGTFRKSTGNDTLITGNLTFTNSATVEVRTNALEIRNGWHMGGTYLGVGVTRLVGGNYLRGTIISSNLLFQVGGLNGEGATLLGRMTWFTGTMGTSSNAPGFTIGANAVLTLIPGNYKFIVGYLTNAGVVRLVNNTTLYLNNYPYARLINLPGGLVDSSGADLFECDGTCGGVIENRGIFRKSAGNDSVISGSLIFTNIATVEVRTNALEIRNGWHVGSSYVGAGITRLASGNSLRGDIQSGNLRFENGGLDASGARLHGVLTWVTGTLGAGASNAPGFTVAADGVITLVPGNYKYFYGGWTNAGVVRLTGNTALYFYYLDRSHFVNLPAGVVESTGADAFLSDGTANRIFENRGLFRKSAGGTTSFADNLQYTNIANVAVEVGTLRIGQGWHVGGRYSGPGVTQFENANYLRGDPIFTNVVFQSGGVDASGARLHGQLTWVTGVLGAGASNAPGFTVAADGVVTLVPGNYKYFYGGWTNGGIVRLTGNTALYFYYFDRSHLVNLPGGVVESAGADLFVSDGMPNRIFENRGRFQKTASGTTTFADNLQFTNIANVVVKSGVLRIGQGWHVGGKYLGPSLTRFENANYLRGDLIFTNVVFQSGGVDGDGAILHGDLSWVTGIWGTSSNASSTIAGDGTLTLVPGNYKYLAGTLNNAGTLRLQNTALYLYYANACRIVNLLGGLLDSAGNDSFQTDGGGSRSIENRGTFRKSGGGGNTTIVPGISFNNNSGAFDLLTGLVNINGPYTGTINGFRSRLNLADNGSLNVNGPLVLGGPLTVTLGFGVFPASNQVYRLADGSVRTGTFSSLNLPNAYNWSVGYSNTFVEIRRTSETGVIIPPELTIRAPSLPVRVITYAAMPNHPWILQATTNLNPPVVWAALTNINSPNGIQIYTNFVSTNIPVQFYRVRSP